MPDQHVTRAHYAAVDRGDLPAESLSHLFAQHAMSLCPTCRSEYAAYLRSRQSEHSSGSLTAVILLEAFRQIEQQLRSLRQQADQEFLELRNLAEDRRKERISRATKRFRNPLLCEVLIEASQQRVFSQPKEAREFARLAFHVALRSNVILLGRDPAHELMLRALAHEANAWRALGDLAKAEASMTPALQRFREIEDPLSRAEISSLGASLRRDQRRFDEALGLIDRSIRLYRTSQESRLTAESLILKAQILREAGALDQAVAAVSTSLELLDPADAPRLYLCAQHDLTCYFSDLGQYRKASERMRANRHLYAAFRDRWTQLRRRWLEGKIAHGLGEWKEAEEALVEVRDGFIRRNHAYDAALASLDIALLYADLGRTTEMQQLAREMMPIFRAQEVHREALAALLLFWEAASREAVTRDMVESLTSYLRQARRDPSFRYEPAQ